MPHRSSSAAETIVRAGDRARLNAVTPVLEGGLLEDAKMSHDGGLTAFVASQSTRRAGDLTIAARLESADLDSDRKDLDRFDFGTHGAGRLDIVVTLLSGYLTISLLRRAGIRLALPPLRPRDV